MNLKINILFMIIQMSMGGSERMVWNLIKTLEIIG